MTQILTYLHTFVLESGEGLPELTIAYQTYGTLNAEKNNVVWVCHALTANADVADWWSGLVGNQQHFSPERYFIVCANIVGSCYGSTSPLSINPETQEPYYHTFPQITIRDMVKAHQILREHLGIKQIQYLLGGSLGGQQCLEWAIEEPNLIQNMVLLATNAVHSPWGIAFNTAQQMAIEADTTYYQKYPEGGAKGVAAARAIALLSYRNYNTYHHTQSETNTHKITGFKAESYQRYQGQKLVQRFNAYSYVTLIKAMNSHNIARNRAETAAEVLAKLWVKTLIIGISSDILFPPQEQQYLAQYMPNAAFTLIESKYGHDGFLLEYVSIQTAIQRAFVETEATT